MVQVGGAVNVDQVLAAAEYWNPPPEDQVPRLVRETLPAVRAFLLQHAQHAMRYIEDRHLEELEELGYEELVPEGDAARLAYICTDHKFGTNAILTESVSPNGSLKVVCFRRDCGDAAAVSTQVSILPSARCLENREGNVLIVLGTPALVVQWLNDTHLQISGIGSAIVMKQVPVFNGIQITLD